MIRFCLLAAVSVVLSDQYSGPVWHLAMNLNPADGHVMSYTVGWATGEDIGTPETALTMDYLNHFVWIEPANYIAIVRHQSGIVDAVKVFRFKYWGLSLLTRFKEMNPGRRIVSDGGPIQETVAQDARNLVDDPIFSVGGSLAFNWVYGINGHRIVLTGGHLTAADSDDRNTHGIGNDLVCNPLTGTRTDFNWGHEISNIQDCPWFCPNLQLQGTDHDGGIHLKNGPVYGNYAIYVSDSAHGFPDPGTELELEISPFKLWA